MLNTDEFVIVVPREGAPTLAQPGGDLSPYVGSGYTRVSKVVALKNGRSVQGSIYRARETTAADELEIIDLLNQQFTD